MHESDLLARITIDSEQCGGRPCIRGIRIRVIDVLEPLAAGETPEEILGEYPYLEPEDITASLLYAARQIDHPVMAAQRPPYPIPALLPAFSASRPCATIRTVSAHESSEDEVNRRISELVKEYRDRCLWFMKPDFLPETDEERLRVLDLIVRHGNRRAYERVMEIRQWLSQRSSSQS